MSNKTATQLAGNASSIFQAWLDLKRQTNVDMPASSSKNAFPSNTSQRRRNSSP